jgi:O-antigen/teichoic acid export membrane protein
MRSLWDRLAAAVRRISRTKVAANFGWLVGERAFTLLLSLTVGVWVARYLGPELFGTFNYTLAFVGLFGTFTYLGISGIAVRDLVTSPGEKDEILGTIFVLKLAGGLVAVLLIGIVVWYRVEDPGDRLLIAILSCGMLFESLTVIGFWYESRVESRLTVRASFSSSVIGAALKCSLILLHAPLVAFVVATVAQQIVNTVLLFHIYQRQGESVRRWRFKFDQARSLLSRSWPLLFSSIGSVIYLKVDLVMLEHFVGSAEVGIYAVAARLSEVWYFIPTALAGSLFPAIIKYRELSPGDYQARMQRLYRVMVLASVGIAVPVTLLAGPLIRVLYGPVYADAARVLMIHIWACPAIFMGALFSRWLISENLLIFSLTRHGFGAVSNVGLNLMLIPRFGAVGAAVATLASYAISSYFACFTDRRTFATGVMMTRALILPFRGVLSGSSDGFRNSATSVSDLRSHRIG